MKKLTCLLLCITMLALWGKMKKTVTLQKYRR